MKKLLASFLAIYCAINITSGQSGPIRQSAIGVNFFLNDFVTPNRIRSQSLNAVLRDKTWAKTREMSPGFGLSYFKGITPHIDFAGSLGASFVDYPFRNRPAFGTNNFLLEADASAQIKLVTENYWVIPYLNVGAGAHLYKVYYGAFMPIGIGFRLNLFDEAGIYFNSQYRIPVTYETANHHFYNSFGVYGVIGKKKEEPKPLPVVPVIVTPKDTDGDGIPDDKDKCPTVPGVAKYDGCPVPDTDGDGIDDDHDKCPTVPGVARYQGCPIPDTDGDGVNDEEDKCPTIPGTIENHGCPEIKEEVKKKVDVAAHNIYFATGSFKLLPKSYKGLNDVVKILKDNPAMKLSIDGHTDNVGKPEKNQVLSENRANSVKNYLTGKGVDASRLIATGHGASNPIANNKTAANRQKNRRVEMKLSYY
jgi:outer membrane protein OmpA-like peptidoglycan-associated protein